MKNTVRHSLYILPFLTLASCDTTEDAHWVGSEPTDVISVDVAEVRLNADGTAQEVSIAAICSWDASLTGNENVFHISPSSGKGDGKVKVSAEPNYGSSVKTSSMLINALNFSKQVTVNIMQSSLTFEMSLRDYKTVGEEGGPVDLTFNSTTGWEFVVRANSSNPDDVGSLDWFDFIPGYKGDGDFYETTVTANWKPNYTSEERAITLVLTPSNQNILEYLTTQMPQPFMLRQSAGTLPTNLTATVGEVGHTAVSMQMSYSSVTDVTECGVRVMDNTGELLMTVAADKSGDEYPKSGNVSVSITGLDEGKSYRLEPYVKNLVGEARLEQLIEVTTKVDVVYEGVRIVDYTVTPSVDMVTVSVAVTSDVNIYEGGISIYNDEYLTEPLVTYTKPLEGMEFTFEISSADFMTPNTTYELEIFVRTDINEARTERFTFMTKGRNPEEGDMDTPDAE